MTAAVGGLAAQAAPVHTQPSTQPGASEDNAPLPQNPPGKTGVKVTRLKMGGSFTEYGSLLLQIA